MGTSHPLSATTNNHAITGVVAYADIAARDADTAFHSLSTNIDKIVRVNTTVPSYFILVSNAPTWGQDLGSGENDEWTDLTDTPSSIPAGLVIQGNAAGDALEGGQNLNITASPTFVQLTVGNTGLVVGTSIPFSDAAGVLTLQNIDVLDAITEATIEDAIDTLSNLTSVGTLTTGIWNATDIAIAHGGTGSSTASGARTNLGLVIGTDVQAFSSDNAFRTDKLSVFAATTSLELAGVISDETGSGSLVFSTSPSFTTPDLGTPSAGTATNLTGTSGITGLGTQSQALDMGSNFINNITDPTLAQSAATKNYVDNFVQGTVKWKEPVIVATTGSNITLSGEQTIDGVLTSTDRILVKDQTAGEENGIYVTASGSWTRATDFDEADEILHGSVWVSKGTINADQAFVCTTDLPITVGTTSLEFVQFSGLGQITANTNLSKTGNVLDFDPTGGVDMLSENIINIEKLAVGLSNPSERFEMVGGNFLQGSKEPVIAGTVSDAVNMAGTAAVFAQGKYVYATAQGANALNIFDVSDPTSPVSVGVLVDNTNLFGPRGLFVLGKYAYVTAANGDSFNIIDVSDKTSPTIISTLTDNDNLNSIIDVYVVMGLAYVVSTLDFSLSIIDVSDPNNPTILSTLVDATNFNGINAITVDGIHAYVTSQTSNTLSIIDISDPTAPTLKGVFSDSNTLGAAGVDVLGKYAYVTAISTSTLSIIDVSDPTTPVLKGSLTDATNLLGPVGIFVSNRHAYIAAQSSNALTIVDVSDPSAPVFADKASVAANTRDVYLVGKHAYVVSITGGTLSVVDVSGIDVPTARIGTVEVDTLYARNDATVENIIAENAIIENSQISVLRVADVIEMESPSSTTADIISVINADSLTTGGIINLQSNSADTSSRALLKIINDNPAAIGATVLSLQQDSTGSVIDILNSGTTDSNVIDITANALTTGSIASLTSASGDTSLRNLLLLQNSSTAAVGTVPLTIVQSSIRPAIILNGPRTTTIGVIAIINADDLTTGKILLLESGSADISFRSLVDINNSNVLATGTTVLSLQQASTNSVIDIDDPGTTTADIISVENADALTTGSILKLKSASTDTSSRNLVDVINDDVLAIGATILRLQQDSTGDLINLFSDTDEVVTVLGDGKMGLGDPDPDDRLTLINGNFFQALNSSLGDTTDALKVVGTVTIGSIPTDISVVGNTVYIIDEDGALRVYDVVVPSAPVFLGLLGAGAFPDPRKMEVSGRYAYVLDTDDNDLKVVDISNPSLPSIVGTLGILSFTPTGISVSGQYVYITDSNDDDLKIVDVSVSSAPVLVGTLGINALSTDVTTSGKYAYVVDAFTKELNIIDVSDPTAPTSVGTTTFGGISPSAIVVSGSRLHAYVVDIGTDKLHVFDISDPTSPVSLASLTIGSAPRDLMIYGNYLAIVDSLSDDLKIIDVTTPTSPVLIGTLAIGGNPTAIAGNGRYVYVVDSDSDDLKVIDISGIEVHSGIINSLQAGTLDVLQSGIIGNNLSIGGGLNVAENVLMSGNAAVSGSVEVVGVLNVAGFEAVTATDEIVVITNSAKFTDQATANIIAVVANQDLTNRFQVTPISATEFTITDINSNLRLTEDGFDNFVVYIGTGTLFTGVNGGKFNMEGLGAVAVAGGTLLNWTGTNRDNDVGLVAFIMSTLSGWKLGSVSRDSTSELGPFFNIDTSAITNWVDSLTVDTIFLKVDRCLVDQSLGVSSGKPTFIIKNTVQKRAQASFRDLFGKLYAGETLVRVDAGIPNDQAVVLIGNLLNIDDSDGLFDTSGSTGAFTVVANNSIAATTITGVTDSSGVASFTHAGTSPFLNSLVTVSGFTTNTAYNTTGIVTARTATTFEIDYVAFGTSETGSYLVTGVTITATAHAQTIGTGVTLDTALSTSYDGGFLIYNIQTNSFDVPATFISTEAGTWSTKGLDQTDPRVLAINNSGSADSAVIAFGFTNANTSLTTITDGVYVAIDVSIFEENGVTQRFKLTNETSAIFELTALEKFEGFLTGSLSALKTGSSENYRFAMSTNSVAPTFATANYVPMEVKTDKINVALEFSVSLEKGDTIQIMVAGDGTGNDLTITDLVFGIK